jgi:hypothetical protein
MTHPIRPDMLVTTMRPTAPTASRTLRHNCTTRMPLIQLFVRWLIGLYFPDLPLGTMRALVQLLVSGASCVPEPDMGG